MIRLLLLFTLSAMTLHGQTYLELLDEAVESANLSYNISVINPIEEEGVIELPEGIRLYANGINYTNFNSSDTSSNDQTSSYSVLSLDGRSKEFDSDQIDIEFSEFDDQGEPNRVRFADHLLGNLSLSFSNFLRESESWVEISDSNEKFYSLSDGHVIPSQTALGFDPYLQNELYQNIQYFTKSETGSNSFQRVIFKLTGNIFQDAQIHFNYSLLSESGDQYTVSQTKQKTVTLRSGYNQRYMGGRIIYLNEGRGSWILNSVTYTLPEEVTEEDSEELTDEQIDDAIDGIQALFSEINTGI